MWIFLSTVVLCVFLFSMALLYVRVQDIRADAATRQVEADRSYDKYVRITRQEAITELTQAINKMELNGGRSPRRLDDLKAIEKQRMVDQISHRPRPPAERPLTYDTGRFITDDYELFLREQRRQGRNYRQ